MLFEPATQSAPLAAGRDDAWRAAVPATGRGQSVLLLGNYRPAIAVARALAREGNRIVLGLGGEGGAQLSRSVAEVWAHPSLRTDEDAFLDALRALLAARPDIRLVLPVAEDFVLFFARRAIESMGGTCIVSPAPQVVCAFADKAASLQRAADLGVPCLPFRVVTSHAELLASAAAIGFPLTVRPLGVTARLGTKKALILHTAAELHEALPEWPRGHRELLLQLYATGERHNLYFAARNGRLEGFVQTRILRTDQPDGTGLAVYGETVAPQPGIVADTAKLTRSCRYTGIGLTQFIVDPGTGARCFLELNPRVSGSHSVPEAFGLPLSRLAVELARSGSCAALPPPGSYPAGLRYAWTYGDLRGLKAEWDRGEVDAKAMLKRAVRIAAAALRADVHMTWSWSDPLPTLAKFAKALLPSRRTGCC